MNDAQLRRRGAGPTRFPELNDLLRELTDQARGILGPSFVGAYLQGSFALGDADLHSDCDFLIPVRAPITPDQETALRALHDEIPTRPGHWTRHLEGSYPNADELRTLDGLGRPWLYIDHGWREMQWSTHCNSEVVRWTLRERGVTLTGPAPHALVDPVPPERLQARMYEYARDFLPDLLSWTSFDIAWTQRYAVASICRILYTYEEARVASKRAAMVWAKGRVDRRWAGLIQQVIDDRERGWNPHEPPRPGSVEQTVAFVDHVWRRMQTNHQTRQDRPNRTVPS